jgi:hypothetical protein
MQLGCEHVPRRDDLSKTQFRRVMASVIVSHRIALADAKAPAATLAIAQPR